MPTPTYASVAFTKWQFGIESVAGTAVAATHVPFVQGDPTFDPKWEELPHDPGQYETPLTPVRTGQETRLDLTGAAFYQFLPFWLKGTLKGAVTPTGGAPKTWTFLPAQTSDDLDTYTAQYGWANERQWRSKFVTVSELGLSYDTTAGVWQMRLGMMGHSIASNALTTGLTPIANPSPLLGAFTKIYADASGGSFGSTQMTGTLRAAEIIFGWESVEPKITDGLGFDYDAVGRGIRRTRYNFTFEQTNASLAEVDLAIASSGTATRRLIRVETTGRTISGGSEKATFDLAGTWRTMGFDRVGSNSVYTLGGEVIYDTAASQGVKAVIINDQAS